VRCPFSAALTDVDLRETHKATWTWGDGKYEAGTVIGKHSCRSAGIYTIKLTLTGSGGRSTAVTPKLVVCGACSSGAGAFESPWAHWPQPQATQAPHAVRSWPRQTMQRARCKARSWSFRPPRCTCTAPGSSSLPHRMPSCATPGARRSMANQLTASG
jgi:hypothetical protein